MRVRLSSPDGVGCADITPLHVGTREYCASMTRRSGPMLRIVAVAQRRFVAEFEQSGTTGAAMAVERRGAT
eukprot:2310016-Amphidinium_carterae.1